MYRKGLPEKSFTVQTARTPADFLSTLMTFRPHALVADPALFRDLPDDVLAPFAESPELDRVPLLVLADWVDTADLFQLRGYPVKAYYTKPIPAEELARCLRRLPWRNAVRPRAS